VIERTVTDITNEALAAHFEHWQSTPEAINALPERLRCYYRLETMSDPAGLVRENVLLQDQIIAPGD
jgi:hypothetical protein